MAYWNEAGSCCGFNNRDCMSNSKTDDFTSCSNGGAWCCDMMSRVGNVGAWAESEYYRTFQTVFGLKGTCKGCPIDLQCNQEHTSGNFYSDTRACSSIWGGWGDLWHYCAFEVKVGRTNPNSYLGGSPNGACLVNCIQTNGDYLTSLPLGYGGDQEMSNFDRNANFDCEPPQAGDSGGQLQNSGPKLVYADGWTSTWNGIPYTQNSTTSDSRTHPTSKLPYWRRKGPLTAARGQNGYDACCSYLSFGCPDPQFGSFNAGASLDCAGNFIGSDNYLNQPATNNILPNDLAYNPVTNPTPNQNQGTWSVSSGGLFDIGANANWEPDIDCMRCYQYTYVLDPTTGNMVIDNNIPPIPCSSPGACPQTSTNPGCTTAIFNACGLTNGTFTDTNNLQGSMCSISKIYEGGDETSPVFGSPGNLTNAPCVCNNAGCMDSSQIANVFANNFSPINTQDCAGVEPAVGSFGDTTCCEWTVYGCTDPAAIINGNNNYFCCDPTNYAVCSTDPNDVYDVGGYGGNSVNGGNCTGGFPVANITLVDDGSCSLNVTSGCMDDGGQLAGGTWPSPLYPGFPANNFNLANLVTVHDQSQCTYDFGCIDPLASNYLFTDSGAPFILGDPVVPSAIVCDYDILGTGPGCTDPMALNYNPFATSDDGSCLYPTNGCTDPNAINYDPTAIIDDGSCEYITDYPLIGTNFLDGSPIELCMEPLTKEEVLINVCQPTEIQSDVFIERGKQSVLSPNQRLGEVKTIGGLENYGYGYYNIKKEG